MVSKKNMHTNQSPIGVFDSGVGGLMVLRKLAEIFPAENLLYLGDTARLPYGNKSPETIRLYTQQCLQFLLAQSVKLVVIACNTATAAALESLTQLSPVPVIGVIKPTALAAVRLSPRGRIGIIGTPATIASHAYELEIQQQLPEAHLYTQACPLLVPLAEEGWFEHLVAKMVIEEYLTPFKNKALESLILGCTHYPVFNPLIAQFLPGVNLIDSGVEAALTVRQLLEKNQLARVPSQDGARSIRLFVSDVNPYFQNVASRLLGFEVKTIEMAQITELSV